MRLTSSQLVFTFYLVGSNCNTLIVNPHVINLSHPNKHDPNDTIDAIIPTPFTTLGVCTILKIEVAHIIANPHISHLADPNNNIPATMLLYGSTLIIMIAFGWHIFM